MLILWISKPRLRFKYRSHYVKIIEASHYTDPFWCSSARTRLKTQIDWQGGSLMVNYERCLTSRRISIEIFTYLYIYIYMFPTCSTATTSVTHTRTLEPCTHPATATASCSHIARTKPEMNEKGGNAT